METERRLVEPPTYSSEVPYTTTDLSPYSSTTSSYSADSTHNGSYYSEFDWHQSPDQNRIFYPVQDRSDVTVHGIYGYATSTSDVYQPNMWHPQQDATATSQMPPVISILPSMNCDRSPSEDSMSSLGPNGKPKRKRIQTQPQRKAANVRERKRMFHLNEAFDCLRLRLPAFNYEKRLSRIETLRLAITYIGFMKDVTDGKDPKDIKLAKEIHDITDFQLPNVSASSSRDDDDDEEEEEDTDSD